MILSLVNIKGGAGKSTSALGVASAWKKQNRDVCIIDFDPEATLLQLSQAVDLGFSVYAGDGQNVRKQLEELTHTHVVVDTPPNDRAIVMLVSGVSDEVVIPLSASGFDLNRLQSTVALVEEVESMRDKALLSVLITRYKTISNRGDDATKLLKEREIPVLDSKIRLLDCYEDYKPLAYTDEYEAVLKELEIL